MLVVGVGEELRVGLQHPGEVERADVEDPVQVDLRLLGRDDLGEGVDRAEPLADLVQVGVADQVRLVEHDDLKILPPTAAPPTYRPTPLPTSSTRTIALAGRTPTRHWTTPSPRYETSLSEEWL
ncbi:hypothetical protein [Micromonospora sp. AMSO31t]|uniref:hypothetical protein n=1 Tax=Micromonospora sp. AMSO31t TaxID=2650566 RepID=UPI00124B7DCD|nr:hypothetical protein [Micromonospora sp. AMSO31t]KAB1915613.1 hypothetical protein F8274_03145 [Micromonospora sp. AMSO31t]